MKKQVKTNPFRKVKSIDHLRKIISDGKDHEFRMLLNFGAYSRKLINESEVEGKDFYVLNYIDDTEQNLTAEEMNDRNKTNIGYAIENGAFYEELDD